MVDFLFTLQLHILYIRIVNSNNIMSYPIRVPTLQVGTPPTRKEWEVINIHYNGFEGLSSERDASVYSPEFTCFGHKWRLQIYPGGHSTTSDDGMIAVVLENRSDIRITINFGFSVENKKGKVMTDVVLEAAIEFATRETLGCCKGWPNFWQRSDVIDALTDGTLIVEVRMRSTVETATARPFIPENPIAKSVLAMFNDEESADVLFEVDNEPVRSNETCKRSKTTTALYGHKFIMEKCASNVLGELCKSEDGDNNLAATTVSITDIKPDIFKHILYYTYGGKISDEDMKENAKDIIDAADKYGIVGLKLEAEASLVTATTMTFKNAIDNLLHADSKNCALLKEAVMDFIAENSNEAVNKLSFDDVPGSVVKDLLVAMNRKGIDLLTANRAKSNASSNGFKAMKVNDLRKLLHEKGLDVDGSREVMIARLEKAAL